MNMHWLARTNSVQVSKHKIVNPCCSDLLFMAGTNANRVAGNGFLYSYFINSKPA